MGGLIRISRCESASPGMIEYRLELSRELRHYFLDSRFFAEYTFPAREIPEAAAAITAVATLLPVAWILDCVLEVPVIDPVFRNSADEVKQAFAKIYPRVNWAGEFRVGKTEVPSIKRSPSGALALFSGGVDSLNTYVARKNEIRAITTVWGADVALDYPAGWEHIRQKNETFALEHAVAFYPIRSNFRAIFDEHRLDRHMRKISGYSDWWGNVQHGLALLGLCAPISIKSGYETVYVPSTYSEQYGSYPWGSHPELDPKAAWTGTKVIHDGFQETRQDKVRRIVEYSRSHEPRMELRVCYRGIAGKNCSRCEKCMRTVVGLIAESEDPGKHGFEAGANTARHLKKQLETGGYPLSRGDVFFWKDLQNVIRASNTAGPSEWEFFLEWFRQCDLEICKQTADRKIRLYSSLLNLISSLPPSLRLLLKKTYRSLKRFRQSISEA